MHSENILSQPLLARLFLRVRDCRVFIFLVLPIILLFLNDNWLFSYVLANFVDTWIYLGYFLDLEQHLNVFPKAYFGTRLPWILPGYLAHHLFSPMAATYILHLVFYYAAISSLYLILKHNFGQRAGFLTALLIGCHFFFLEAIGSNYIDGAGVTYLLLTLLMITNLSKSKYMRLRLCFAGIFYGCLIYTQLFLITYTPLVILYYFFINPDHKRRILNLTFVVFGFTGLTLLLCTVNYFLNGRFWFLKYVIKWTSSFVATPNPWWQSFALWPWLLLPTVTVFGSVATLLSMRSYPHRRPLLFFQAYFILTALIHVIWQIKFKQPVLNLSFYASYLLPATFLALGSQLALAVSLLSREKFYLLLAGILSISLLAYFPPVIEWAIPFDLILVVILFGVTGVAALFILVRKEIGISLIVLSIVAINLCGARAWPIRQDVVFRKDSFLSVFKSVAAIQSMDPESKSRFWYNDNTPYGSTYRSVASTYLWAYRLINEEFPVVNGKNFSYYHVALNDRIFILSNEKDVMEKANQNLAQAGFKTKFLDERTIEQGSIHYKITYVKICSL